MQKAVSYKTYNDSVDAGTPSPAQNHGYIRYVALLAIVDPFEHAICCLKLEIHIWLRNILKKIEVQNVFDEMPDWPVKLTAISVFN